jgi:hypothetical protein
MKLSDSHLASRSIFLVMAANADFASRSLIPW